MQVFFIVFGLRKWTSEFFFQTNKIKQKKTKKQENKKTNNQKKKKKGKAYENF